MSTGGSRRTCWMVKTIAMPQAATNAMDGTTIRLSVVVVMMLVRRTERQLLSIIQRFPAKWVPVKRRKMGHQSYPRRVFLPSKELVAPVPGVDPLGEPSGQGGCRRSVRWVTIRNVGLRGEVSIPVPLPPPASQLSGPDT